LSRLFLPLFLENFFFLRQLVDPAGSQTGTPKMDFWLHFEKRC
jgi:hypothetical protein